MKIAVIGSKGYVGSAMTRFFRRRYEVHEKDLGYGEWARVNRCDMAVICVPTEPTLDGSCDISIVREVLGEIDSGVPTMIKSTVPPGTTNKLSDEFKRSLVFIVSCFQIDRFLLNKP